MCAKGTPTSSPIPNLLVLLTGRQEVPPYWGGWLDRLPFCPVTDTLHMCHSCGLVTSPARKEDEMRRREGRGGGGGGGKPQRSRRQRCQLVFFFLPPCIEIDIGRTSRRLIPAKPSFFFFLSGGGGCLGPALLSASRARLTVSAKCHSCRKKGALTLCFYTTAALLRSTDRVFYFFLFSCSSFAALAKPQCTDRQDGTPRKSVQFISHVHLGKSTLKTFKKMVPV